MKKSFLFLCGVVLILTSCGPGSESKPGATPEDPAGKPTGGLELQVGSDFLDAPENTIKFDEVRVGVPQYKYLVFKAPANGELNVSKSTYGIGINCSASDDLKGAYSFAYEYQLKDATTAQYAPPLVPRDLAGVIDQIALTRGEEVRIRLELHSRVSCTSATVIVTATFH